jgi:hypothetical protein
MAFEQGADPSPHDFMVIRNQNSKRFHVVAPVGGIPVLPHARTMPKLSTRCAKQKSNEITDLAPPNYWRERGRV